MQHPADLLASLIDSAGSPACVGLDPVLESLPGTLRARHHQPVAAIAEFSLGVIRAVAGLVPAVKLQSACYERYGPSGLVALDESVAEAIRLGLFVVLDAKRGDIGISANHYAAGAKRTGANAVTVSGYLGPSGITPFLDAGLLTFVLVRTSNPDSDEVQSHPLTDGRRVCELMADLVASAGASRLGIRGMSAAGAVVGATKSADGAALRARMPRQILLVPGYGSQGGTRDDVRALLRPGAATPGDAGVLVTASRSVIYAQAREGESWDGAVRRAASKLAGDLRTLFSPDQK